ncbi:MarR family winged helix-turn-helix transcriptional regulator [Glaciihabitans sp. dw_435]|uniref:MarR family winged helix-turn-helix transcriptional regulator n=1 Tax=Glaciihabitans sp. dw_435 TaxID=2720081 RepID=UPI001BD358B2|nr:winged helix DNA-binding protein [Glaciihabitans sp. dw_435]
MRAEARGTAADELGRQQQSVLYRIGREGPISITDLAATEYVRHQSMAQIVAALRTKTLVEATPDPEDGRRVLVRITPAGAELIRANFAQREEWLQRALTFALAPDELERVVEALGPLERIATWEQ